MSFGTTLIKLRKRKNMTQKELAEIMQVRQYIISYWESERSEPSISQLSKLADTFSVPVDYLIDKETIRAVDKIQYENTISNINRDVNLEEILELKEILMKLVPEKRRKVLKITKEIISLIE